VCKKNNGQHIDSKMVLRQGRPCGAGEKGGRYSSGEAWWKLANKLDAIYEALI